MSLCVSLDFVGWKIGLVFRLSDGTLVWCPVADNLSLVVVRVPSTIVEGDGGENQKQKKVVGSGVVVLAHARREGQGNLNT